MCSKYLGTTSQGPKKGCRGRPSHVGVNTAKALFCHERETMGRVWKDRELMNKGLSEQRPVGRGLIDGTGIFLHFLSYFIEIVKSLCC